MRITIQEALRILAELRDIQCNHVKNLKASYIKPCKVNGKFIIEKEEERKAAEGYRQLSSISQDMVSLRNAIDLANQAFGIRKNNILLQEKKRLLNSFDLVLSAGNNQYDKTQVVSGVGVVERGLISEEILLAEKKQVEEEIRKLQNQIDQINISNFIEIELLTR